MKARKLPQAPLLKRARPTEGIPTDESGALARRVYGWTILGGLSWFAVADTLASALHWGLRGAFVVETVYVIGISASIPHMLRPLAWPNLGPQVHLPSSGSHEIVRQLTRVAALHDGETACHCERIGALAYEVAIELRLGLEVCERLRRAAVLHDLGKIGVDRSILQKPGPLDPWERSQVERHVDLGVALLEGTDDPILGCARVTILSHHERWDGAGYPHGLAGEEIPLEGRIVAVCDAFDALATDRPYQPAVSPITALAVLQRDAGAHFDPDVVDAFARCFPRLVDLYE